MPSACPFPTENHTRVTRVVTPKANFSLLFLKSIRPSTGSSKCRNSRSTSPARKWRHQYELRSHAVRYVPCNDSSSWTVGGQRTSSSPVSKLKSGANRSSDCTADWFHCLAPVFLFLRPGKWVSNPCSEDNLASHLRDGHPSIQAVHLPLEARKSIQQSLHHG